VATGHTAIVTGANHGISAATAQALAQCGCPVLCTFLRFDNPDDPGTPAGIPGPPGTRRRSGHRPHPGRWRQGSRRRGRSVRPGHADAAVRHGRGAVRAGRHPGQQRDRMAGRHLRGGHEDSTTLMWCSATVPVRSCRKSRRASGSRLATGSSRMSSSGRLAMARVWASWARCPPDSRPAFAAGSRPSFVIRSAAGRAPQPGLR
jgi:hypothetical protein